MIIVQNNWIYNKKHLDIYNKVTDCCCADGTAGTPFCGYGRCNIFGCACKGGCRRGPLGRNATTRALPLSVETYLDSIPVVEDHLNWEVAYLVGETMHKINEEL